MATENSALLDLNVTPSAGVMDVDMESPRRFDMVLPFDTHYRHLPFLTSGHSDA